MSLPQDIRKMASVSRPREPLAVAEVERSATTKLMRVADCGRLDRVANSQDCGAPKASLSFIREGEE